MGWVRLGGVMEYRGWEAYGGDTGAECIGFMQEVDDDVGGLLLDAGLYLRRLT